MEFARGGRAPWLKGGDELSFGMKLAEAFERLKNRGRMMGEIIVDAHTCRDAAELLAPLHAAKLRDGVDGRSKVDAACKRDESERGGDIAKVMKAAHRGLTAPEEAPLAKELKLSCSALSD